MATWPTWNPPDKKDAAQRKKERERRKKAEWEQELARLRERASRKHTISLGPKSREKYDALYAKSKFIIRKIWSDDVRACYEAAGRVGSFDDWASNICERLKGFKCDAYTSGELDRLKQEIIYAELGLQRFLDQYKWVDPVYRAQLPDRLRNARSSRERRLIMQRMATPKWVDGDMIKAVYLERIRLSKETGIPHDVDHIVPITHRRVCGLHVPWNLRVIPSSENRRKSNKFVVS